MPGRQSTRAPSLQISKSKNASSKSQKKKGGKRSLNALAIAEKEAPERTRVRTSRLGESEPTTSARKRDRNDDNADEEEDEEEDEDEEDDDRARSKRSKPNKAQPGDQNVEYGSDSSGNEWTIGAVDDDESSLDSDEAMGESDEDRFEGFAFSGSSKKGRKTVDHKRDRLENRKGSSIDMDENESYQGVDDEDDSFGEEGIDLAAALDEEAKVSREEKTTSAAKKGRRSSDRERPSNHDDPNFEREGSVLSFSDGEDDEADASKLASLQNMVSDMGYGTEEMQQPTRMVDAQESTVPSEFGLISRKKLTIADLASSVTNPLMKKSLEMLADEGSKSQRKGGILAQKLEAPLPQRQQDQINRGVAYDKSKETLGRWIETVKQNRRAEHLSFPLRDPTATAPQGERRLVSDTMLKPMTEFERNIQRILKESGLAPEQGKTAEQQVQAFEELKTNKMPIEEVLARRAELRQQRDLLFREEIRAKRIKKIKSKTYRKIHRRERERTAAQLKDAMGLDEDDSGSDKERRDRRRAEERMGAKHRESRWAKGIKESGRAKWDEDARAGVSEMARRDEELRKRIEGREVRDEDASGISSDDDDSLDEADDEGWGQPQAEDRLKRLEGGQSNHDGDTGDRLANMAFMKRAEAVRYSQNEEDIKSLRKEFAGTAQSSDDEQEDTSGRKTFGPSANAQTPKRAINETIRQEFEERDDSDGDEYRKYSKPEESNPSIVINPGHYPTDTILSSGLSKPARSAAKQSPWNSQAKPTPDLLSSDHLHEEASADGRPRSALKGATMAANAHASSTKSNQTENTTDRKTTTAAKRPLHKANIAKTHHEVDNEDETSSDGSENEAPIIFRNAELAKRAFAGDNVVEKFSDEKTALIAEQAPQTIDTTMPGWGTWTGLGISKRASKPHPHHRTTTHIPGTAAADRKDAKLKNVIISEKRVKKTGKYLAGQLPHPFETKAQYERSLRLPVGPEWTTKHTVQSMTMPRIMVKSGTVIRPMLKPLA